MVEFRTHDGMFSTIHAGLYPMLVCECRDDTVTKVMDIEKNDFGWDFPETLLPPMKQLICQAIEVHDLRAPEDKPGRNSAYLSNKSGSTR